MMDAHEPNETRRVPREAQEFSRRGFLCAAAAGSLWPSAVRCLASDEALRLRPGVPPSRVVRIQDRYVVDGLRVQGPILRNMLDRSLCVLTGASTAAEAWHSLLKPDDVVGLKFNRSGQETIGTTPVVAETIVGSLIDAGWAGERIVCIEAPSGVVDKLATRPAVEGYRTESADFGSGSDQLAAVLDQVSAIIDVPFLKTHNITGMTCALKNLSHGLIKHPARYHRNGCSPYITDIVALPDIRDRLRLCVVDALRVVFDGGPMARGDRLGDEGMLLVSRDPVATDLVGLTELDRVRRDRALAPVMPNRTLPKFLSEGHQAGLGAALWAGINLVNLSPG